MTKKLYIKTWGCQMNEYDSSKIINLLHNFNNVNLTKNYKKADILLLNTCSIRKKAQEKLFHQLNQWFLLKKLKPDLIIAVGGCVASQESDYILNNANYIDIIFGPQSLHRLPEMIDYVYKTRIPIIDVSFPKIEKFNFFLNLKFKTPSTFVSIMEGCNKYCTFCVVPYTRGEEISRPYSDILVEITQLANKGIREVILLGQNVNAYYCFFMNGKICSFSKLLRLVSTIEGIDRIRYLTSHPSDFNDELINTYYDLPKLVSFIHLPIQSGSDRILHLMKRGYSVLEYKSIIYRLRKIRPNIQISSDFIVGFPGETNIDFKKTISIINEINFDFSFSFIYSARPGTPAANIKDNINKKIKKQRLYLLKLHIMKQTIKYSLQMKGTIQRVLIEGFSRKNSNKLYGRTENNRIVYLTESPLIIGQFVYVKIINVYLNSLYGIIFNI